MSSPKITTLSDLAKIIREVLANQLPPGVPLPFAKILSAEETGAGKDRQIHAELLMIDGLNASITLTKWALGWSTRYTKMPGGPLSWENGSWRRCPEDEHLHSAA